jgi:hypothetical protein
MSPTGCCNTTNSAASLRRRTLHAWNVSLAWLLTIAVLLSAVRATRASQRELGAPQRTEALHPASPGGKSPTDPLTGEHAPSLERDEHSTECEHESELDGPAAWCTAPARSDLGCADSECGRRLRQGVARSPRRARAPPARD